MPSAEACFLLATDGRARFIRGVTYFFGYRESPSVCRFANVVGSAAVGAALTFAVFSVEPVQAKLAVVLLASPVAILLCGVFGWLLDVVPHRVDVQRLLPPTVLGAYTTGIFAWASHALFRDSFGGYAMCGYALAVALGAAVAGGCSRLGGPTAQQRALLWGSLLVGVVVAYTGRAGIRTVFHRYSGVARLVSRAWCPGSACARAARTQPEWTARSAEDTRREARPDLLGQSHTGTRPA